MIYKTIIPSPFGPIKIVCDERHLLKVSFSTSLVRSHSFSTRLSPRSKNIIKKTITQLREYFKGKRTSFSLPLDFKKLKATEFQRRMWAELLKIPHGKTITYAEQALRGGRPAACRAAGGANGKNPIAIVIPCHRVVAANGKLGGFTSGLWRKRRLLKLEKSCRI